MNFRAKSCNQYESRVEYPIFTFVKHVQVKTHNGQVLREPLQIRHGQSTNDAKHLGYRQSSKHSFSSVAGFSVEPLREQHMVEEPQKLETVRVDDSSRQ
jgi:hypothetical protein